MNSSINTLFSQIIIFVIMKVCISLFLLVTMKKSDQQKLTNGF